jgi:hypothetical protein
MHSADLYPGKAMLTPAEVRQLLRIPRPKQFREFLEEQPLFPRPVKVGKTSAGKPRLMYVKHRVYAFLDLWGK